MIKAMDEETRRCMEAFDEIENLLTHIHDIASLMSAYTELNDSAMDINPTVIGRIAIKIVEDVLKITKLVGEERLRSRAAAPMGPPLPASEADLD